MFIFRIQYVGQTQGGYNRWDDHKVWLKFNGQDVKIVVFPVSPCISSHIKLEQDFLCRFKFPENQQDNEDLERASFHKCLGIPEMQAGEDDINKFLKIQLVSKASFPRDNQRTQRSV